MLLSPSGLAAAGGKRAASRLPAAPLPHRTWEKLPRRPCPLIANPRLRSRLLNLYLSENKSVFLLVGTTVYRKTKACKINQRPVPTGTGFCLPALPVLCYMPFLQKKASRKVFRTHPKRTPLQLRFYDFNKIEKSTTFELYCIQIKTKAHIIAHFYRYK